MNFDSPYRATSPGEFWKRWHITLTSFLRECVYFPLGGSRKGTLRTYCNIFIVYLVSGLWHGAGWTFLIWGAIHGLGQIADRMFQKTHIQLPRWLGWLMTFLFVSLAWVFFRSPTISDAIQILQAAVAGGFGESKAWLLDGVLSVVHNTQMLLFPSFSWWNPVLTVGLYGTSLIMVLWPHTVLERMDSFRPKLWQCILLAAGFAWCILSFSGIPTFIYSNF